MARHLTASVKWGKKFMNKLLSILFLLLTASSLAQAQNQSSERLSRDALLALREQRYQEAISLASAAQEQIDKSNVNAYVEVSLTKVRALSALDRHQEALEEALVLEQLIYQDSRVIQLLGEIYYNLGQGSLAMPYFADYIAFNPTGDAVGRSYFLMGEIYLLQGRYNHAEIAFTTAVYYNSSSDRWWFRLGYAREQAATIVVGSERTFLLVSAKNAYERAVQLNPSHNESKERISALQRNLR
jgi:tetratricopeptide (TPR) repeat protein